MGESRNSSDGLGEGYALPGGVGGRQPGTHPGRQGGGYQDIYTSPTADFKKKSRAPSDSEDPRLAELEEMGLPDRWLQIARGIGFDNFMEVWRILDEDNPADTIVRGEQVRIWIPRIARYVLYQRNLYIRSLAHLPIDEIIERLRIEQGVSLHRRTVQRVLLDAQRRRGGSAHADTPRP